ncbi:ATP-binding protein [Nonomuraea sp. NBC_00507]|uniref:ATP-binding protein n=1 Tax=Nonomuraea sp. NBC_00507 TaxID=2976002 RepID=UPI002E17FCA1
MGREEELAVFHAALYGGGCSVLYVHGPGGIGKSALLRRFAHEATLAGRPVSTVDGRTPEPSPAAFEAEAELVLRDADAVLLVDNFDRMQGLEGWLRDLLRQAIDDLREDPRSVKFHRALSVTFLHGTPTQELAAEHLALPFTTYRRHLTAGIKRLCADPWHQELSPRPGEHLAVGPTWARTAVNK